MCRNLKFLHMTDFFSTGTARRARDKYQVWFCHIRLCMWIWEMFIERIETRKLSKYWHWEVSFKLLSNFGCDFQKCSRGRIVWNCKKGWEVSFQSLSGFGCDFQKCSLTSLSLGATIHSFISDLSHSYLLLIVFFTFRLFNFSTCWCLFDFWFFVFVRRRCKAFFWARLNAEICD